jgi:hypothetical protein
MAQVITRPQRFTPEEWKLASKIKHKNAERNRVAGERLILEADRLDVETREQSDTTLQDVEKKLGTIKFVYISFVITVFGFNTRNMNIKYFNVQF